MKKLNKALIKCAVIVVIIGFSFLRSSAQGTLLNETTLERTMYQNNQNGLNPFDNILEQHFFMLDNKITARDMERLIQRIKKEGNVISILNEEDKIIVLINKSEMQDASYKIKSFCESLKISVISNYVLFYFKK